MESAMHPEKESDSNKVRYRISRGPREPGRSNGRREKGTVNFSENSTKLQILRGIEPP